MALFSKQEWVDKYPQFFMEGNPVSQALGTYSLENQTLMISELLDTLSVFYGGFNAFFGEQRPKSELVSHLTSTIFPAWRFGLSRCSVAQIITGLFLVMEGKTKYVDFAPNTVLKFNSVCTEFRPAFHDVVTPAPSTAPRLGWDPEQARKKTEAIQKAAMIRIAQMLKGIHINAATNTNRGASQKYS